MSESRTFAHAMLREIYEQPAAIETTLARYVAGDGLNADSFGSAAECFLKHKDLVIAASGSSRHAGLAAEIMLEDAAGLSVDVEYASEYISRSTNTKRDPAVLVISQSGETADTLAALREAKRRGHPDDSRDERCHLDHDARSRCSAADAGGRGAGHPGDQELYHAACRSAAVESAGCRGAWDVRCRGVEGAYCLAEAVAGADGAPARGLGEADARTRREVSRGADAALPGARDPLSDRP